MTKPLVVILGATACGKSKLAIDLARRFGGEIISADSMQVYHGLDIVTNKVTEEEQMQAKHHMINIVSPLQRFSVIDFKRLSLDIIKNLQNRGILPIVVGGTNYYIESLIWKSFTISEEREYSGTMLDSETEYLKGLEEKSLHTEEDLEDLEKFFQKPVFHNGFAHIPSEKLWKILEQVDKVSAHLYHPNNKRRIIRCLQIIQRMGRNYSDILRDINKKDEEDQKSCLGGPLRFDPTCVLWLDCNNLDSIMDDRVEQMLSRGLLAELENFHSDYYHKLDYQKGIFQSIGFKEFHQYLMLDSTSKGTEEGNEILRESIARMKLSTKHYAKSQIKWIRRRFLHLGTRVLPPIYKLDTGLDWDEKVKEPAISIVESMLNDWASSEKFDQFKQEPVDQAKLNYPGKLECEICNKTLIGSHNIQEHLSSRSHIRRSERKKIKNTT